MDGCNVCKNKIKDGHVLWCPSCKEKFCEKCADSTKRICPKCFNDLEYFG